MHKKYYPLFYNSTKGKRMSTSRAVLVSQYGPVPIFDVKICRNLISNLDGLSKPMSFDVDLRMRITAENTLFTEVSFPRSNTYALKFGYIEVTTKQQTLHLVQRTLDTLKEYSDYIPNIKELYEERHDDFFEQTLKAKICNLEDAFVVEEKPLGAYLGIVRALTELRIALCPGDLVNDFTTYATTEEFQHCSSTLLNQSLHSLIKDPWRLQ